MDATTLRDRLRLAWVILQGRPVAYRLTVTPGGLTVDPRGRVHGCTFSGTGVTFPAR